jgi:hypothetical protein
MSIMALKPEVCPHDLEVGADTLFASANGIAVCLVWFGLYVAMVTSVLFTGINFDGYLQDPVALIALE